MEQRINSFNPGHKKIKIIKNRKEFILKKLFNN